MKEGSSHAKYRQIVEDQMGSKDGGWEGASLGLCQQDSLCQ